MPSRIERSREGSGSRTTLHMRDRLMFLLALACVPDAHLREGDTDAPAEVPEWLSECGELAMSEPPSVLAFAGHRLVGATGDRLTLWNVSTLEAKALANGFDPATESVAIQGDLLAYSRERAIEFSTIAEDGSLQESAIVDIRVPGRLIMNIELPWMSAIREEGGNVYLFRPLEAFGGGLADARIALEDGGHFPARGRATTLTARGTTISSADDGTIREWAPGAKVRRLPRRSAAPVTALDSLDGEWLAGADSLGEISLWEEGSGVFAGSAAAHPPGNTKIMFVRGGDVLASASDGEPAIRLWEPLGADSGWGALGTFSVAGTGVDFLAHSDGRWVIGSGSKVFIYCEVDP